MINYNVRPTHDRLPVGALLAAAAGGLDAYTYLQHGEVFAGLQTGNLILLGASIGQGHYGRMAQYVTSILMFLVGAMIARWIQKHWPIRMLPAVSRSGFIIVYEIVLLLIAGAFSSHWPNMLITGILSLVAAAQLQEFRQLNGGPFTSLMMTGNVRTLAESIYDGLLAHDKTAVPKGLTTGTVILSFVAGAGVTALLTHYWHGQTIWLSAVILAVTLGVSHLERREKVQNS
ncbi:YoaK family protein [Secundilactobacillus folii]|uniref:DUF1275 domain-containing protein n=1 Tax=Secundilactobacillus folii TaxID=2678357 RepID=A0A7X2XX51_9LACO|nr:YoaK family protein [Secundilactobacillus folii]MTV83165.1 DUF1275 domain-containing protein [Secundilactobacillus folii]